MRNVITIVAPSPANETAGSGGGSSGKGRGRTRERFNFEPLKQVKMPKKGTLRALAVDRLRQGATMQELEDLIIAFDWRNGKMPRNYSRRAYELVRVVHNRLGFGVREEEDGTVRLVEPKDG